MTELNPSNITVMERLRRDSDVWTKTPDYATFNREQSTERVDQVSLSIVKEGDYGEAGEVARAYNDTLAFINNAFDMYENKGTLDTTIERAFIVPMRTMRDDERYATEVLPFVPLLNPKYGVNSDVRQRTLVGLPPAILDIYSNSDESSRRGALVLAPLFGDMPADLVTAQSGIKKTYQRWQLGKLANRNINLTAQFVAEQLQAKTAGLGATIASVTEFGNTIRQKGLVTTTGHAGTVHLMVETAREVIDKKGGTLNERIGIIGSAGSIGYATLDAISEFLPDFDIAVFDKNEERLRGLVESHEQSSIDIKDNAIEVLRSSDLIMVAITSKINLDELDPHGQLDLRGKYIIDDSQPGCFDKEQVERRGGKLLWVVGLDGSDDKFLTRDNGYNYGDEAGIWSPEGGPSAIWGCEAEAGVIAASGHYDMALRQRVEPRHVRSIGKLCVEHGVKVAPFQAYGQPVNLN